MPAENLKDAEVCAGESDVILHQEKKNVTKMKVGFSSAG